MTIHALDAFRSFIAGLPGTSMVEQWGSHVAKVGDKVFTLLHLADGDARIVVKCPEESFEILTALHGIGQAPYFAKRKWVSISAGSDLSDEEVRLYIRRSHDLVARGLTRKLRRELGIDPET